MNAIDVIVPCYRYGRFLRECITSITTQPIQDLRVLIIDDASPDNTYEVACEIAREDDRITVIRHAINLGHITTFNEGLDWASARYLLLLSADDYLLPGSLTRAVSFMDAHPNVGFVFGMCMAQSSDGIRTIQALPDCLSLPGPHVLPGPAFIDISGARNIVPTPTAVVRTSLQKQVGGYLHELPHTGDMEMWLRLAAHADVGLIDELQAVYRRHESNMSLSYANGRTCLPDFVHRRTALDVFHRSHGQRLTNAEHGHARRMESLGREALIRASWAFNDGNMSDCKGLSELALDISAGLKRSVPRMKLAIKHAMGRDAWLKVQAIQDAFVGDAMKSSAEQQV